MESKALFFLLLCVTLILHIGCKKDKIVNASDLQYGKESPSENSSTNLNRIFKSGNIDYDITLKIDFGKANIPEKLRTQMNKPTRATLKWDDFGAKSLYVMNQLDYATGTKYKAFFLSTPEGSYQYRSDTQTVYQNPSRTDMANMAGMPSFTFFLKNRELIDQIMKEDGFTKEKDEVLFGYYCRVYSKTDKDQESSKIWMLPIGIPVKMETSSEGSFMNMNCTAIKTDVSFPVSTFQPPQNKKIDKPKQWVPYSKEQWFEMPVEERKQILEELKQQIRDDGETDLFNSRTVEILESYNS